MLCLGHKKKIFIFYSKITLFRHPSPCGRNSECQNLQGSYTCKCLPGFMEDPDTNDCVDIDECEEISLNDCTDQQSCTNTEEKIT